MPESPADENFAITGGSMLIFQRRSGNVHPCDEKRPLTFPNDVTIEGKLEPREVFNSGVRSGKLPFHLPGSTVIGTLDPVTNETRLRSEGTFAPVQFEATLWQYKLRVNKGCASLTFRCEGEPEFLFAVEFVHTGLPAFLSGALPVPVSIHSVDGCVGDSPFEITYPRTTEGQVMTADGPLLGSIVAAYLTAVGSVEGVDNIGRLTAAHRYLMQARQLSFAGESLHQFVGERILNLAKALHCLFPYPDKNSGDHVRSELSKLGVQKPVIEMFVSVIYLRNQLDVGHPAMAPLDRENFDRVVRFAGRAQDALAGLLRHVVVEVAAKRYSLAQVNAPDVSERAKLLKALIPHDALYINPYGPDGSIEPRDVSTTNPTMKASKA